MDEGGKALFCIKVNLSSLVLKVNYFSWITFKVFALVKIWSFLANCCHQRKTSSVLIFYKLMMGNYHTLWHTNKHSENSMCHWNSFWSSSSTSASSFQKEPDMFWITLPQWRAVSKVGHHWENRNMQWRIHCTIISNGIDWSKFVSFLWTKHTDDFMMSLRNQACGAQGSKS